VKVKRYPFHNQEPPYSLTCYDIVNQLLGRIPAADELIYQKMMELPHVAEAIKSYEELTKTHVLEMDSVELCDVEVWLTKKEWISVVKNAIETLEARASILKEHLKKLEAKSD
jgi:S-adenosylmethionine:diacylglycerol 3-amino-3-carboxypropyl transferase